MSTALRDLLQGLLRDHFGGKQGAMAEAIGLAQSHLSRVLKDGKNFGPENCLRVSLHTGVPAPVVLRAAGKDDLADLIEQLYGPAQGEPLLPRTARVIDLFEGLTRHGQELALQWLEITSQMNRADTSPPQVERQRKTAG